MKTFEMRVKTTAYATITCRAPDTQTAFEYVSQHLDVDNLDFELDTMDYELDASQNKDGDFFGVKELTADNQYFSPDYVVDTEWLEANDYEVVVSVRQRKAA